MKLNGAHQLLVYAEGNNILGGSVHTVKGNEEALVVDSKETGLEVGHPKNFKSKMLSEMHTEDSRLESKYKPV